MDLGYIVWSYEERWTVDIVLIDEKKNQRASYTNISYSLSHACTAVAHLFKMQKRGV